MFHCNFFFHIFFYSVSKTRVDFLRIVATKFYKHPNDAIRYLKKHCVTNKEQNDEDEVNLSKDSTQSTDPVLIQTLKEIRSFYPLRAIEKITLMAKLTFNVIILSGWIFYVWAFATDIELLYRSFGCVSFIEIINRGKILYKYEFNVINI